MGDRIQEGAAWVEYFALTPQGRTALAEALADAIAGTLASLAQQVEGRYEESALWPNDGRPLVIAGIDPNGAVTPLFLNAALEIPVSAALRASSGVGLLTSSTGGSADGLTTTGTLAVNTNYSRLFNGASWDRQRANSNATILPSAARTVTTNSADQTNYNGRRMLLLLNVSAQAGGSITPSLQVKDSISGNYMTVWAATAAQTAVGIYAYYFADGAAAGGGGAFTEVRPAGLSSRDWRLVVTHNNASSITYSASAAVLL